MLFRSKTAAPAALRVALKDGLPTVSAVGAFDIDLPLKLMLKGKPVPLGDLHVYTDPALGAGGVQALFEQIAGDRPATPQVLKVDLPDFERLLSTDNALLKMLYDPTPVLDGIDMGLGELQRRLTRETDNDVQRIGLSATVGNPAAILTWLAGTSKRAGEVIDPPKSPTKRQIAILTGATPLPTRAPPI